jgi:hypothetical protein
MAALSLGLIVESLLIVLLVAVLFYCQRVYRALSKIEGLEAKKLALESALNTQIEQAKAVRFELGTLVEEANAQSRARIIRYEDAPSIVPNSTKTVRETMIAAQTLRQRRLKRESIAHAA